MTRRRGDTKKRRSTLSLDVHVVSPAPVGAGLVPAQPRATTRVAPTLTTGGVLMKQTSRVLSPRPRVAVSPRLCCTPAQSGRAFVSLWSARQIAVAGAWTAD